ncbi:integrase core domain-containing protein [Nocardia gipuzkoensis]
MPTGVESSASRSAATTALTEFGERRQPWNNGLSNRSTGGLRSKCLNRIHWTGLLEARVVIGTFKDEHNRCPAPLCPGYLPPAEYSRPAAAPQRPSRYWTSRRHRHPAEPTATFRLRQRVVGFDHQLTT